MGRDGLNIFDLFVWGDGSWEGKSFLSKIIRSRFKFQMTDAMIHSVRNSESSFNLIRTLAF